MGEARKAGGVRQHGGEATARQAPPFGRAEYLGRLGRTRAAMAAAECDLLLVSSPENILWLSGYQAKGIFAFQMLLVPLAGAVLLVIRGIECGNIRCLPADTVVDAFEAYGDTAAPIATAAAVVRAAYPSARTLGVEKVSPFLGAARLAALSSALDGHRLGDASHLVDRVRLVKSAAEIACFRRAAAITDAAMRETIEAVAVGATDHEIAAVSLSSLMRNGSEYCATWPNIMLGWRAGLAHAGWDGTRVAEGEPVALEFAASVERYHAPIFRTVIPGRPKAEVGRAAACIAEAHDAGLAAMGPGKAVGEVDAAIRRVVTDAGCARYAHSRFGYSLGLAFPPTWAQSMSVDIVPGAEAVFAPGMLFHILVYLLEPATFGVATSETVLVTETGIEALTRTPKAPLFI